MARDRILQIYRGTTAQNNAFTGAQGEITMDTTRKELRVHDGSTVGGNLVGLKPGFVCPFAGTTAPDGWLICDGSAISRTTYADLFAVIGTTYGEGDGNTTFNLPKGNFPFGTSIPTIPEQDAVATHPINQLVFYKLDGNKYSANNPHLLLTTSSGGLRNQSTSASNTGDQLGISLYVDPIANGIKAVIKY